MCYSYSANIDINFFLTTKQFEEVLITDKKKLSLVEPRTVEDHKFLQSISSPILDPFTVDLSFFDTEKTQGYAIVFKQIDGKSLPSFCANTAQLFKSFSERPSQGDSSHIIFEVVRCKFKGIVTREVMDYTGKPERRIYFSD